MALQTQRATTVPTGHDSSAKTLEDQAATAALYLKRHDKATIPRTGNEYLDNNYKLSTAGAAASLKYANPQDLPSFPSPGLKKNDSAAGAAASLGWANQKLFTHWKPDPSTSASAAALHAKDYKMAPLWEPESSTWGNSAALLAFKKYGSGGLSPVLDRGYSDTGRSGSLLAATGAMSQGRKRAESTPITATPNIETYPDEKNATTNALRAAASASRRQKRVGGSFEQGAIPYTAMPREMYTSHPPVALEVDESERQGTLHASAVAMAKNMYTQQQKQFDAVSSAQRGATTAHARRFSSSTSDSKIQPMGFSNLQEAAQKLANERLAKLHDEHAQNREFRDYYTPSAPLSKLTGRGRARRRATSDGGMNRDKEESDKIRAQMSQFSNNLSQIDAQKRQKDRDALIAAAQRNVTKQLHGMDERVFADTGKVPPSLLNEWEAKAHAAANEKSQRRTDNYGKVHIGGGKFINQSEVDQVAHRNVQPVLDDIQEKADAERERQAVLKAEQETAARKDYEAKMREKETKEINKKLKQQDKELEKARKSEEKEARKEEARRAKERRKSEKYETTETELTAAPIASESTVEREEEGAAQSNEIPKESITTQPPITRPIVAESVYTTQPAITEPVAATGATTGLLTIGENPPRAAPLPPVSPEPAPVRTSMEDEASLRMRENAARAYEDEDTHGNGKVRKWLKTRFSRRLSRGSEKPIEKGKVREDTFVGDPAFDGADRVNSQEIIAGPSDHCAFEDLYTTARNARPTSADEFQEARDTFQDEPAVPPTIPVAQEASPVRNSRFMEEI